MTEDKAEKLIQDWQFYWMNQSGYSQRALGVDANMKADLARRLSENQEGIHPVGVATGDLGPCFLHPNGSKDDCLSCQHMKGDGK